MFGSAIASFLGGIASFITITLQELVVPLIPMTIYAVVVIAILTVCLIIAGVGGSMLFYIILAFYVKALLSYNPVLEERAAAQAEANAAAQANEGME